jgi:hypothetical protein
MLHSCVNVLLQYGGMYYRNNVSLSFLEVIFNSVWSCNDSIKAWAQEGVWNDIKSFLAILEFGSYPTPFASLMSVSTTGDSQED